MHDFFNPKFTFASQVTPHELRDCFTLPRHSLIDHLRRAVEAWQGGTAAGQPIVDHQIEILTPIAFPTALRIDLWVEQLTDDRCTYGFLISSQDGNTPFARGERIMQNVDPHSGRPLPWTSPFRAKHATLLRELPAYA